jgi:hypothetical protein
MGNQTTKNDMDCTLYQTTPARDREAIPRRRYPIGTGRHWAGELEGVSAVATKQAAIYTFQLYHHHMHNLAL